eukprot:scaffold108838_cov63-Phaeocystis_antarctica.AAC.7
MELLHVIRWHTAARLRLTDGIPPPVQWQAQELEPHSVGLAHVEPAVVDIKRTGLQRSTRAQYDLMARANGGERRLCRTDAAANDEHSSGLARAPAIIWYETSPEPPRAGLISTPASDLLPERALALGEQLLGVKYQPRGEVRLKRRGNVPLPNGARGQNHRAGRHHVLSLVNCRLVVHAELACLRVLGHAGGGSGAKAVGQLGRE